MRPPEFYQAQLDAVSRSFALCIPQLAPPFRERVALSYLLLRVLDTVEDAPFAERQQQARQFETFRRFLREPPRPAQLDAFRAAFPSGITAAERALLADAHALFEDTFELPEPARAAIVDAIDRMARGMALYAARGAPLRLVDLEDVTRYCCIVAGLVGELLTRLWALAGAPPPRLLHAYRFGLFLQKVNILKDQAEDEAAGRFLVPDRDQLLASLRGDAEGALDYLTSLPPGERGYRTFCAWSLMLGAASLAEHGQPHRSRRTETLTLLGRTAERVHDDAALRAQFAELLPELPRVRARPPVAKGEFHIFLQLMHALDARELAELGAISHGQYG